MKRHAGRLAGGLVLALCASLAQAQSDAGTDPAPKPAETAPDTAATPPPPEQADAEPVPTIPVPQKQEAAPVAEPTQLDEVTVTAQKRVQRLVDVPINVSSMSRDDVQKTRIEQVRDVAGYMPNMDIKEQVPGAIPVVSIRGVGLDDFSSTNSPAAGVYVDQVTLSSLALMSFDLYDIERIEVLKGPQGTLYGRNSTAGAISILSAPAAFEREGYLRAGAGTYKTNDFEGMFNLPLSDSFAVRAAGKLIRQGRGYWQSRLDANDAANYQQPPTGLLTTLVGVPPLAARDTSGDPIRRDIGKRDIGLYRVRLGWVPADALKLDFKVEGQHQRSEMGQPEGFGTSCKNGAKPIDFENCTDGMGYSDRDHDPYKGDWRGDFPYNIDQLGETLIADADLGFATLTSVTGHIKLDRFFHIDVDGTPADAFDFFQGDKVDQWTQEARLAGSSGMAQWLAGAFWSKDKIVLHDDGRHQDAIPGEFSTIDADQLTKSAAAFVNIDWKLSERLSLVTGLRYTHETRSYVGGSHWTVLVPGTIANTHQDSSIADSNWSWKFGASYAPTHTSLLYANASKGTKSGGYFSGVTTDNSQLAPYKPEQLIAYEIGAKTQGQFAVNTSVFYYDYKDVQTFMRNGAAPVQFIGNVPKASTMGLDAEAIVRALDGLTLQAGLGLLRTRLGEFTGPDGTPVAAGNRLANSPKLTFNGLARYEFPLLGDDTLGALQADAYYSADAYKEATNDPLIHQEPYWIYNARASVLSASHTWEVALWGRNLTNELYVVQGLDVSALFFGNRNYNAPRTAGVEVSVKF